MIYSKMKEYNFDRKYEYNERIMSQPAITQWKWYDNLKIK